MSDETSQPEDDAINLFDKAAELALLAESQLRSALGRSSSHPSYSRSISEAQVAATVSAALSLSEISLALFDLRNSMHTEQASIDAIMAGQVQVGQEASVDLNGAGALAGKRVKVMELPGDGNAVVQRIDRPGVNFIVSLTNLIADE